MSAFAIELESGHIWVTDRGERVLLFVRMPTGNFYCNALFVRQPGTPAPQLPESYHSATAIGAQADIRWRWGTDWQPMEYVVEALTDDGVRLVFSSRQATACGEQRIEVALQRGASGRAEDYVLEVGSVLLAEVPPGQSIEFLNFLPADAGNSWPRAKRFTATVHELAPGKFERRPHSQLSVLEKYYWSDAQAYRRKEVAEPRFEEVFQPECRSRGVAAPYAVSHLFKPMAVGGTLFFSGEVVTPAVGVRRVNAPTVLHTCDVWFDEHFCLAHGVMQPDGRTRYAADYVIFALAEPEAKRMESAARNISWSHWAGAQEYPAFYCDQTNTFTLPAAREYAGATGVFFVGDNARALLSWERVTDLPERGALVLNTLDPVVPPSGQYYQSVRAELSGATPWAEAFPLGFALHLARGDTLEFSALIRTGEGARASLELREAFWGRFQREHAFESRRQTVRTEAVCGGEWTRAINTLTAKIPGSLAMIFLRAEGRGRAYFTELRVRRVDAGKTYE